ncbi:IS1096 element passenger TnpR family protein [Nitrospira sp. CMX1]
MLREISPEIWHQVWVLFDSTIANLHDTLLFAIGWSNSHLIGSSSMGKHTASPRRRDRSSNDPGMVS